MARQGRLLEEIVEALEKGLAATDVEINSPDHIEDVHTGVKREVDVSLRAKVGSARVLGIVECRDRGGPQDVTWIEQINSKRGSVGADFAVAVSSEGFTGGAISKASALGIRLLETKDLTLEEFQSWFTLKDVRFVREYLDDLKINIIVPQNHLEECGDWSQIRPDQPLLRDASTGEEYTMAAFSRSVVNAFSGRIDFEKLREIEGYPSDLGIGESWESPALPADITLPPDPPMETLSGVPVLAIRARFDHRIVETRQAFSIMKSVSETGDPENKGALGYLGMIENELDDGRRWCAPQLDWTPHWGREAP